MILRVVAACAVVLAGSSVAAQSPGGADASGNWKVALRTNPLDDSAEAVAMLKDDSRTAELVLRCSQNRLGAYVAWRHYLGSEHAAVTLRLGTGKAETKRWGVSTDHRAAFYPGNVPEFLRALTGVERIVVQVTPYGESPVTSLFDVRGVANAIIPLKAACGVAGW